MLALRALAVRVLVVRVRAGRLRAGCGVLVQHSLTSCGARRRHRHHIPRRPDLPLPIRIALACPYACARHAVLSPPPCTQMLRPVAHVVVLASLWD